MTREKFEYKISIMQKSLNLAMKVFTEGEKMLAEEHLETSIFIGKNVMGMFPEKVE